MLGIDVGEKSIRVVKLHQKGSDFVLWQPLEVSFDPEKGSDPIALGEILRQALVNRGWLRQDAIMILPHRDGFVKRLKSELLESQNIHEIDHLDKEAINNLLETTRKSMLVSSEELVLDLWRSSRKSSDRIVYPQKESDFSRDAANRGGTILVGAAQGSSIEFCQQLAAAGGIKLQSLELHSVAAINGLWFNWNKAQENNIAVVYRIGTLAHVALIDTEGLVFLQSFNIPSSGKDEADEESMLAEQLSRVFNTLKLEDPRLVPQRLFLAELKDTANLQTKSAGPTESLEEQIRRKTGLKVTCCYTLMGIGWHDGPPEEIDILDFVAAIGAALDGLAVSPTWFDFLHPRGRHSDKKRIPFWRPFAVAGALSIFLVGTLWLALVKQRMDELSGIERQISQMEPQRDQMLALRNNWNLFSTYLPESKGGKRIEYLRILYEINELMPSTSDAYITNLTVGKESTGLMGAYDIQITMKVCRKVDVGTEFIERLNNSKMFQEAKQAGTRTHDETDPLYPISFSVTCNLRKTMMKP